MGSDRRCGGVGEFLAAPCGGVIATGLDNIGTRSSCVSNQDIALRNIRQVVFQMPDGLGGGGLFSRIVEVAGCVLEGRSQDLEILAGNDGAGGMIGNPSDRSEGLMRVDSSKPLALSSLPNRVTSLR